MMCCAGYGVSDKLANSISDVTDEECWACGYCDSRISVYQIGMFGALISTSLFLLLASALHMPVSTTHAIVGGGIGFTIAAVGVECVKWDFGGVGGIFASWLISPVLSGVIGVAMYVMTNRLILKATEPQQRALTSLYFFYPIVTWIMIYVIFIKGVATSVRVQLYIIV